MLYKNNILHTVNHLTNNRRAENTIEIHGYMNLHEYDFNETFFE